MQEEIKRLKEELESEIEDLRAALYPLLAAASEDSGQEGTVTADAAETLLDMAFTVGEMRLTAYQLFELLDKHGAA